MSMNLFIILFNIICYNIESNVNFILISLDKILDYSKKNYCKIKYELNFDYICRI
jgi:hypothetical protein